MRKKDSNLSNAEIRERLALMGLTADRETAIERCPDDGRFAEFLEADPASPEQQSFVNHLASCESCRQKWLILSEELSENAGKGAKTGAWFGHRGLLSLVGSACALAAGVTLYLAIDYRPVQFDGAGSPTAERPSEAPTDQGLRQVVVPGADTKVRKKLEVEKLAEADTAEPLADVVLDRQKVRTQMSAEMPSKPASAPAKSLGKQPGSPQVGPLHDQEGFSANVDALESNESLKEFIDSFSSLCESRETAGALGADLAHTAEQGRALLELEKTMETPYNDLIEEIVQLLAQKEPVKDTELDKLCTQVGRVAAEMDKAGP